MFVLHRSQCSEEHCQLPSIPRRFSCDCITIAEERRRVSESGCDSDSCSAHHCSGESGNDKTQQSMSSDRKSRKRKAASDGGTTFSVAQGRAAVAAEAEAWSEAKGDSRAVTSAMQQEGVNLHGKQGTRSRQRQQQKQRKPKQRHQCSMCGEWFLKPAHVRQHQQTHEGQVSSLIRLWSWHWRWQ